MTDTSDDIPCREARRAMRELFESAHSMFMNKLEVFIDKIEYPLPYSLTKEIQEVSWGVPMMSLGIATELSETINQLHTWYNHLKNWSLWIETLEQFDGNNRWYIHKNYVEQLAFYCMFQPSATRERFGTIATNALHQANLELQDNYKDRLDQDQNNSYMSRRHRENQLLTLGIHYSKFPKFMQSLRALDDKKFKQISYNFRDLASHGIAPRFEQGETSFVTRSIEPWSDLVEQPDGSHKFVKHETKTSICYTLGARHPLTFQQAFDASWHEYLKTIKLFHSYQSLLREILSTIKSQPSKLATVTAEN